MRRAEAALGDRVIRALIAAIAPVAAAVIVGACGPGLNAYPDAMHGWRAGQRPAAVVAAQQTYEAFRDDNDLQEVTVRAAVARAHAMLDEVPVLTHRPPPLIEVGRLDGEGARDAVDDGIRQDLLSGQVTAIFRGARAAEALRLDHHGPELLTVVFRTLPIADDGGVLQKASTALRSVAAKRVALDVLDALIRPADRP